MKKKLFSFIIIILILGSIGLFIFWMYQKNQQPPISSFPTACPQDAKLCPDGSSVSRSGLNCEFASCPSDNPTTRNWQIFHDGKTGVSFKYPEALPTKYIFTPDWPPQVQILKTTHTCTEAGQETVPGGRTMLTRINGRSYCVTTESEGAAGSIYTQYAFDFSKADKTIILTFTIQEPHCENYDEPGKSECETERTNFNLYNLIDIISQTLAIQQ